jgi:hypothetical protein
MAKAKPKPKPRATGSKPSGTVNPHGAQFTATGGEIASAALKYAGKGVYRWGGGGPFPRPGGDCSGFVNWVLSHDLGLAIPGRKPGTFTGKTHGPVVLSYAVWRGAVKVKKPPHPGDLCVWAGPSAAGHIGIAVSSTEMVSALDTQSGVVKTPIHGFGPVGVPVTFRRIKGSAAGVISPAEAATTTAGAGCLLFVALAPLAPIVLPVLALRRRRRMRAAQFAEGIEVETCQ